MGEFILDPCVEDELWDIWEFIARDNPDSAIQVIKAAFETFSALATNPELGRQRRFHDPRLRGIRSWRVAGFDSYLVFYRISNQGIQVHHVYHGARDIEALFGGK